MRIPLGLSYGLRCGESMKRRDIAEEEKDDFSKILHGPKKPLNYFYRKSQIKYSYHGTFTEKPGIMPKISWNSWGKLLLISGIYVKIEVDSAARNLVRGQRETINIQYNVVSNPLTSKVFAFTDLWKCSCCRNSGLFSLYLDNFLTLMVVFTRLNLGWLRW